MHSSVLSHVQGFVTPRTVAHQAPLSIKFSRQEYWSRLLFSTPGGFPDPWIEPALAVRLLLHHLGHNCKMRGTRLPQNEITRIEYLITFL